MRVFHFLAAKYGVEALQKQRVKVATLPDLNDPFELFACVLRDRDLRRKFRRWKEHTSRNMGLLCFSRAWSNPLLWSHYADRHRGIALELEVADDLVVPVRYTPHRIHLDMASVIAAGGFSEDLAEELASTKALDWSYEDEVRVPVDLRTCIVEGPLRFEAFTHQLEPVGIVIGALSEISLKDVEQALPKGKHIAVRWCRPAFGSFDMVCNRAKPERLVYGAA